MKNAIDGALILNPDGSVKRPKPETMKYDGDEYSVLEIHEVAAIVAQKGRANIIQIVADGDEIISADLVLGMQIKETEPKPPETITVTFSAMIEENKQI